MTATNLEKLAKKSKTLKESQLRGMAKSGTFKTKLLVLDHPNCTDAIASMLMADKSVKVRNAAYSFLIQSIENLEDSDLPESDYAQSIFDTSTDQVFIDPADLEDFDGFGDEKFFNKIESLITNPIYKYSGIILILGLVALGLVLPYL